MADTNDNIRKLHQALKSQGYNDIGSEDEFRAFVSNNDNVKRLHQSLKDAGFNDLGSEDEFGQWLSTSAAPSVPAGDATGTAEPENSAAPSQQTEQQPVENAPTFEVGGNGYTFTADELQKMEEGQRPVMKPKYGTPEYGNQKIEGDASNPYAGMTRQQAINAVGKKFFNEWYGKDHTPEATKEVDGEQVKYGGLGAYDQIRAELAANNIVDPENYANVTKDIRRAYIPEVARRRIQQLMGGFESANHWNAEEIRNVLDSREAQQAINQDLERLGFAPTPEAYDGDQQAMHRDIQRYEQARQYYYKQLENELENVLVNKFGWLPSKDYRSGVESFRDELISGGAEEHEERIRDREALSMVTKYATPQVQKYFNEAEEKGREAYRQALNSVPGVSQASAGTYQNNMGNALGAALYAGYAENKETDPGKIWAAMEPNLKQMGINLINDPGFMKEAETRAAEEGMELGDYLRLRVDPVLESIYQKEFERIAVENEMPKNFVDYALGHMRDSLPGVAINWAVNSPARRRAQQRAMQLTDVGQGKWTPNIYGRMGGGFLGMVPDLALFGVVGKAVAPVGGAVTQELSSAGFRPLVSRLAGASITNAGTMGGAEAVKGFAEGLLNDNDYEHITDKDDRSFLDVLGDAVKTAVERSVPSFVSGAAMVGNPIAGKIFNGTRGIISKSLKIGTQAATDAAGSTLVSVISGDIKPEDAGEHFFENFGTFIALALQGHAKEIKKLGNGNTSWNGVEFTEKDTQILEDLGLDKFRNLMKDIERARNRKGLIGQSIGLEATKEQVEAAKSEGAKLYNEMMRSYAIPYELKVKIAQAMDAPLPDYAYKPEVLELSARVPAESVDLGLVDMLEYEYNREGGVADKVKQGQELDSNELNLRLLFQENKAFNEAVEKLQRGEELTDEEQSLIVRNQRRLNDVQTQYYRLEHERVNREFEAEHGLEPGTMNRLLRDVAEGKAINDANIMKEYEEYLRGVDQRLGDARAEVEARKAVEAEAMAEAERQIAGNTEEQVGGVQENESINKAEVVTENETTPPPPLVMDEKGEVLWEQSPVEATVAGLTERVGRERVGQIVDEEIASLTDELTSLSERRVKNMNERLQREQDIADVAERMVYWQQVKDAIAPKEEAAKPEEAAPETPVVKNEAEIKPEEQKPEEQKPVDGEMSVEAAAPAAPDQPVTPPEDAERPAELTAEQKVAQGTVNNNTGKRFGFQNQDGSRSEIVIDGIGEDGKVEVTRQDYDADGRETGDTYKQSLDMVSVGNSIVNGTIKPALTTEEKLRQVHKFDKFKVGDVPLIDVLTDAEQRQVLEALERGDTEAVGNMTPDLIKAHHEDLILKGRDDRNAKVRSIMEGNGSREQKLRKVRELYKGYNDAEVSLEDATLAPTTLEEYVADLHSRVPKSGEGPIAYFSYKQGDTEVTGLQDESGYGKKSSGDADAFKPWLAPKGKGMSLMKYAEQIHSQLPEEIQKQFDVNDVRNAILDVFSAAERPSDITTMILKRGVEQAEQAVRRMEDNWIEGGPSYQKVSADDNSFAGRLTRAKEQTNAEPTEKQKAAGNYKKGHVSFGGYDFVVENPEGSVRRGEADGKSWEQKMNNTYGYILGKRGKDGDHLDMFINDAQDLDNFDGKVYVIDQVNPKTGEFDEHKIMYGFDSEEAARDAYLSNYEEGWQGLGRITGVDKDTFDKWLDSSDKKIKAFAEHSIIRDAMSKPETKKAVTNAEIDKAFVTELDKEMKNAGVKVADTLEEVEEGQAVLDAFNGEAKMMAVRKNIENGINALQKIADGEESVPNAMMRDDLSQYGGDNNITFYYGKTGNPEKNFKGGYGIAHIGGKHGAETLLRVLNVIADGKIDRYVPGNKTVVLTDGEYEAVLALTRFGDKETWLFNGWKKDEKTGADGEVSTHSDATQANPTFSREDLGAVLSDAKLRKENETSKNLEEKIRQQKAEAPQPMFFKTPEGHAYGFTYKGKIYVDPRIATAETPIHEYGHLWAEMKRQTSPKEWDAIKEALLNDKVIDPFIEKVRNEYPELLGEGREDDFIEEVLTQFSGKHGAERLRRMAEEIKAELGGDATAETIAQAAIRRVKSVLNDFWKSVCDMMGWKYTNAEDVADTILRDMLNGVNPNDVIAKAREGRAAENPRIKPQLVGEKGAAEADKAEGSTVRQDNKAIAEEMEKEGKDSKAIKFATGWERGKDGKWRYETTDAKVDIITPYEQRLEEMKKAGIEDPSPYFKLSELLGEDNELFKYYPKLKDMEVTISDFLAPGVAGSFDGKSIELNKNEIDRFGEKDLDNENVYGTLLHEVQHAVQDIEGFAKGGSLSTATTEEGLQAIVDRKQQQRADLKQRIDANEAILNSPEFPEYAELAGMDKDAYFEKLTDNNYKMAVEYDRLKLQIDRINKLKTVAKSDAIDLYHSLAGEVEARNATERAYLSDEQRRNKPASETEDVSRDKQVVIMGDGESASMSGGPMLQKVSNDDMAHVELNVATARDKESRDYMKKVMEGQGMTEQESNDIMGILDNVSDEVMKLAEKYPAFKKWQETGIVDKVDPEAYDAMWRMMDKRLGLIPNRSAFKKNGDYPLNIDLGALCTKREAMDALMQIIVDEGGAQNLGPTQIEALKDLLKAEGFLTACDICFVETKRARAINDANKFAYDWESVLEGLGIKDDVEAGQRDSLTDEQMAILAEMTGEDFKKAYEKYIPKERRRTKKGAVDLDSGITAVKMKKIANLISEDYSLAGKFNPEWLLTTRGTDWLFRTYGPHTRMCGVLAEMNGSSTAKPLEGFNIYDALSWKKDFDQNRNKKGYSEKEIYDIGGVRAQSFTDFNPILFLDYVQMFSDLAVRRLPMHMYTKVPSLVKLFGETGTMINMSLVPAMEKGVDKAHAGLKPDGKGGWDYAWADESFPVEEAMELRQRKEFGGRVGTIAVGVSDEHIRKMLDDERIDMIIPYHKSGMPVAVQVKTGLKDATDYTDVQNTQGAPKSDHFNYNEKLQELGDPRKAAQAYLDWCDEHSYTPKFPQFRDHKNYYKLLEDFRGYDGEGNPVIQGPVRLKLTGDWKEQLDAALADRGDTDRRIGEMKQNKQLMDKAHKLLQYQRLDGEVRKVMMDRLGAVLGENNVRSLRQEEFFDALESAYAETMGDAEAHAKVEVLRSSDGRVYGFAHNGKVTFNENLFNANTPAHEFTHVWVKVARKVNPKRWAEGKDLLKESKEWQEVMDDPLYKDIRDDEDAVASEALSRIVGKMNEDFVRRLVDPSQKQLKETKLYGKILDWLRDFFKGVRSVFTKGGRELTFDEFIRMPMKDLWDEKSSARFKEAVKALRDEESASMVDTDAEMHVVTDKDEIERLDKEPTEKGYRNVVVNEDGTLGSPMANRLGKKGEGRKATTMFEFGKWERSDENPSLANENGKIDLIKPDGKTVGGVDYNPYIHIRPDKVNRQFKQAWERPNLIYVETEYPASELKGEYQAEKAAKPVGKHKWGTQGESLILSRWDKPVRMVPWEEVADDWVKAFKDRGVEFDIVPPKLLPILAERGVEILPPHKGMGKACNDAYEDWIATQSQQDGRDAVDRMLDEVDARKKIKALGVPYQGGKSRIATKIIDALPDGKRFVDLFSGGGSMTHAAMLSGKYDNYRMNDINPVGQDLFMQGVRGEWKDYARDNMTEEEFNAIKGTPEALPWSFNGLGRNLAKDKDGRNKAAEQIRRVQALEALKLYADAVETSGKDYRNVELKDGDVVYADIPYEGTDQLAYRNGKFDKEAFNEWALAQDVPVYVSEYSMPEGWTEIASFDVPGMRGGQRKEKVFVQSKFAENGETAGEAQGTEVRETPRFQRVEGGPEPELTPEERQYWKKYEDDLKKWKARNGLKEDAQEPMAVPRMNAGESATDYAKRVMEYAREKAKWKTAPRVEDYRQRRLDKDMVDAAREEEKRYPDSQSAKMRRAAAEFQQIRTRIGQQKAYDKATVKAVTDFAQDFMRMGFGDNLTKGEISRLLSSVKNATGASSVKKEVDNIMNVLMDSYLRDLENRLVKLSSVKELNQTAQGVEKQGKLELKGQRMIQAFREARQGRWTAERLRERLSEIDENIDRDEEGAEMWEQEREGVEIALQYAENIEESRQEWEALNSEYKDAVKNYGVSGRTYQEQQQLLEGLERAMQENKMERIAMYGGIMGRLQGNIEESIVGAKEFREREREHTKMIHAIANFDTAGMDMSAFRSSKDEKGRRAGLFFSPLGTFEQMLKQFGSRNAKGEGYLYDYFLRNWMDSTNRAYEGEEQAKMELDEKAQAVFGDEKVKRWSDIYKLVQNEKKMPGMEVEVIDQGERKQLHLTQGNMLYIYMANKMNDGAMKLRKMGITEEDVAKIKENLDERLVELGDWLQDEYLPAKRVKYNQVHERMFGAPMAAIDRYFPIKVLGDARQQDVDMNEAFNKNALPSTITGSIIKRKKNTLPLDILHTDALSLAIEHIEDMEQWAAMAEWKKDISTLLSYTTFRNKVKNMKTIYGSGNELWRNFFDAATIAAGEYQPKRGDADKAVTNIAKGVTSAKINFRLYTAFKQILSAPAFAHDVRLDDFIKNSFNPYGSWKWAMENMPVFRKRVNSRKAGDTRLEDTDEDWKLWKSNFMKLATRYGMSANAFVDAVTCAVGARSIYETRYRKYLKMGADEEKAHQRAMQDAMIGYNLTQQSSEGAFVSKIQKDRTVAANMLSVFRNGPMAYGRQEYDAYRNLKRMLKASSEEKEDRINFMAKQLEEGLGLNSEQAHEAARKQYNRAMWHELGKLMNMAFGVTVAWNLGASLPYLLVGDDWETKEEMLKDAVLKGIAGPVEGFAGGNLISDMMSLATNKDVRNAFGESFEEGVSTARKSLSNYEINPLPLLADLDRLMGKSGGDIYEFANDLFNIWAQSNLGFNPQTFTDFWNACVDYAGDPDLHNKNGLTDAREIALFLMRVANAPTSSWKNKLIDELGADIDIDEAKRMTYDELAKRYANYKGWKDAPLTGFLRSDESREEMLKKKEEQFKKAVQERLDNLSNEEVVDMDVKRQDDAKLHEAAKKQINKRAEKMSEEELKYLFDNVFLIDERKTVGKEMARRLGFDGEKDEDGKKIEPTASDADYFMRTHNSGNEENKRSKKFYVTMRTWQDIAEDLDLEVIKRDAKAAGDEATAKAVDDAKEAMLNVIKQLGNNEWTKWDGTVVDEEYRWSEIRRIRREALDKLRKKQE